ncbi:unnamed protein product [Urochloa humidicola]
MEVDDDETVNDEDNGDEMVGGSLRRTCASVFRRRMPEEGEGSSRGFARGLGRRKGGPRRRGRSVVARPVELASPEEDEQQQEEDEQQQEEDEDWQGDAHQEEKDDGVPSAEASGSEEEDDEEEGEEATGGLPTIWLRGPSQLPQRPIPPEQRPVIQPVGSMSWMIIVPGSHSRKVNGILGLLCREHFPGQVHYRGRYEPAWTWDHYVAAPDGTLDREHRCFENKAERVKVELWDFYRCEEGKEERAAIVAHNRHKNVIS